MKQPYSQLAVGLLLIVFGAAGCAPAATAVAPTAVPAIAIPSLAPATATEQLPVTEASTATTAVTEAPAKTEAPPTAMATATLKGLFGCVPACLSGYSAPGDLPAGDYQTQYFFGHRMQVMLTGSWTSTEDSTGEFSLAPKATPKDVVKFWEDVYPVDKDVRVEGVSLTAEGLFKWLSTDKNFKTTAPVPGMIGTDIPATVFDVSIAPGAANQDPGCPAATCLLFLGFPQWGDRWGIAGNQVQRFYLANVSYGGVPHLFVVVIYPDNPASMERLRALAEPLIASVRVPVDPH